MNMESSMNRLVAFIIIFTLTFITGCETKQKKEMNTGNIISTANEHRETNLSCKLTTPELQHRKETVIEKLKREMLGKKELENGYAFKFSDNDSMMYELTSFIRTEMQCCDFFAFKSDCK